MADPRHEQWAQTLVNFSVAVQPGQTVAINGGVAAEPLMRAIYNEVIKAGGFPSVLPSFSGLGAELLKLGTDDQLSFITPIETFIRTQADVVITVMADTNTKALATVDPKRQQFFSHGVDGSVTSVWFAPSIYWAAVFAVHTTNGDADDVIAPSD